MSKLHATRVLANAALSRPDAGTIRFTLAQAAAMVAELRAVVKSYGSMPDDMLAQLEESAARVIVGEMLAR